MVWQLATTDIHCQTERESVCFFSSAAGSSSVSVVAD